MHASAANYEQTVLEAFAQVADLLEAWTTMPSSSTRKPRRNRRRRAGLDLARASYAEGNAGVLQVLDAERSYQQARLGYVRAKAQRYWIQCSSFSHSAARVRSIGRRGCPGATSRGSALAAHSHMAAIPRDSSSVILIKSDARASECC